MTVGELAYYLAHIEAPGMPLIDPNNIRIEIVDSGTDTERPLDRDDLEVVDGVLVITP